jgi:hypothetical protein
MKVPSAVNPRLHRVMAAVRPKNVSAETSPKAIAIQL